MAMSLTDKDHLPNLIVGMVRLSASMVILALLVTGLFVVYYLTRKIRSVLFVLFLTFLIPVGWWVYETNDRFIGSSDLRNERVGDLYLPRLGGIKFGDDNMPIDSTSIIIQWNEDGSQDVVWPEEFATAKPRELITN